MAPAAPPDVGDYYEFLGVPRNASPEQIKLAYRKKALQYHPDRAVEDKEAAKEKFQQLGHVYGILSNPRLRDIYDKTGSVANEEFADFGEREWDEYFRQMYPKISKDAIKEFEKKYKGSEEELADLKEAYLVAKGDMEQIIDTMILATIDDEERFRTLLMPLIESKELPSYKKFVKEDPKKASRRRTKAEKEAKEAEEHAKELGLEKVEDNNALAALIQRRNQNSFDAMISRLEGKYKDAGSKNPKGGNKRKPAPEEEVQQPARKKAKKSSKEEVHDDQEDEDDAEEEEEEEAAPKKKKTGKTQGKKATAAAAAKRQPVTNKKAAKN